MSFDWYKDDISLLDTKTMVTEKPMYRETLYLKIYTNLWCVNFGWSQTVTAANLNFHRRHQSFYSGEQFRYVEGHSFSSRAVREKFPSDFQSRWGNCPVCPSWWLPCRLQTYAIGYCPLSIFPLIKKKGAEDKGYFSINFKKLLDSFFKKLFLNGAFNTFLWRNDISTAKGKKL